MSFRSALETPTIDRVPWTNTALRSFTHGLLMISFCFALCGCGRKSSTGLKPVSGTVTFKGDPVKNAIVSLAPKSPKGRSATATTDENGTFKAGTLEPGDGAAPGEYDVTIRKTESEQSPYARMSEMDEQKQAAKGRLPIPKIRDILPAKYGKAATSGLSAKVGDEGAKDLKFELTE